MAKTHPDFSSNQTRVAVIGASDERTIQVLKPFFRIEETLGEVRKCLEAGWTGAGFKTVEFEEKWSDYTGHSNTIFVNSGTSALHLALETLKLADCWDDGDEVVTTSLTFVSTNHVILQAGLTPVFADIDKSLCIDLSALEKSIGPRTRAVIFVGIGGNAGQLVEIEKTCRARGIRLIIDAAHMAGTQINGVSAGLLGDAACYSFQAVKNLPSGDSGALCFKEEKHNELARKLSWMGITEDTYSRTGKGTYSWNYGVEHVGFKYNGNSIMAAIALVGLRYLDEDNEYRRKISDLYDRGLENIPNVVRIPQTAGCLSSRHLYQIRVKDRDGLIRYLHSRNIFPGVHYLANHLHKVYQDRTVRGKLPEATLASAELLSLPLHMGIGTNEVERVVGSVREFVA